MTADLQMLLWSAALFLAQMAVAAIGAQGQVGLPALAGNREALPAITGWAGRARRAHANMLENLVVFAIVVLIAHVAARRMRRRRWARSCSSGPGLPMP